MEAFLKIITSKLAGPVLGALLLAALFGNGFQFFHGKVIAGELTDANATIARLTVDNATLKGNQATLKGSVATQNAGADSVAEAAELAAANAKLGQAQREAAALKLDAAAAAISKSSPSGADHCAAASALIRNTLAGEHQQ